jgi:choline dehydrogenase-like flavoprotein
VRLRPRPGRIDPNAVDNLSVVNTSFFSIIGAVNPALSAMANTFGVGARLLTHMGARSPQPEPAHVG